MSPSLKKSKCKFANPKSGACFCDSCPTPTLKQIVVFSPKKKERKIKAWALLNKCKCGDCKIRPQLLDIEFSDKKPQKSGYIVVPCEITYQLNNK